MGLGPIDVFPNPAVAQLHIRSEVPLAKVEISNLLGEVCMEQDLHFSNVATLQIGTLKPGVYMILIEDKKGAVRQGKVNILR